MHDSEVKVAVRSFYKNLLIQCLGVVTILDDHGRVS